MYDVRVHLPARLEALYDASLKPDVDAFLMIVKDIKELIMDDSFQQDLDDYERERDTKIDQAKKDCIERIKKAVETDSGDDAFVAIAEAENELSEALNEAVMQYIDVVKTYIISYMKYVKTS